MDNLNLIDQENTTYVGGLWMCNCRTGTGAIHHMDEEYCENCEETQDEIGMPLLVEVVAEWALGYLELDPLDVIELLDALADRVVDGRIE